jgi:cytochrome c556
MLIQIKIILFTIILTLSLQTSGHKIELENKLVEEIINERMKKMSIINKLSQKIYKQLNAEDFDIIKKSVEDIEHAAIEFKELFPLGSNGGKAKNIIWEKKILFYEYNDNFLIDIRSMSNNIEEKNITLLKKSFNSMASNCGTCHKKFKNK